MQAQAARRVPRPLKRTLTRVLGRVYWLRRRVRRAPAAPPAAVAAVRPGDASALPAGAPDCIVAENEHGAYCVPRASVHRLVSKTILEARVWERATLDLVREAGPAGDIVHAGTFFGDFIPALARSRGDGARVWAFEPGRENYECASATVALNGLHNVVLRHAGLDSQSGTALLATTNRAGVPLGGASRVVRSQDHARWTDNERVELIALDEALDEGRRVAVIQLDVEGHEQQALSGALQTIARWRPLLVLETPPTEEWLERELAPLGYSVAGKVDANTVLRASRGAVAAAAPAGDPGPTHGSL